VQDNVSLATISETTEGFNNCGVHLLKTCSTLCSPYIVTRINTCKVLFIWIK